jgi:pyrroloquinoline-quinone synthase
MDTSWWNDVEGTIKSRFLMNHPYNQAWREGRLQVEDVREYAKQYFHHVNFFPRYLSAVHSNTSDINVRQMLLENLIGEEQGSENHPELFLRFGEGAGVAREDVLNAELNPETKACVDTFMELARNPNPLAGLAALYAYESQIPEVAHAKVQRLDVHYGIVDERAYKFFNVHEVADVWHSQVEREALLNAAKTDEDKALVKESVQKACDAVWNLFNGISRVRDLPLAA